MKKAIIKNPNTKKKKKKKKGWWSHLPSKHEAPSSNLSNKTKQNKTKNLDFLVHGSPPESSWPLAAMKNRPDLQ
jgi:hypothetical protein